MMRMSESTFLSSDGTSRIYFREYLPETEAKGVVQLAHGVAEHSIRYENFARHLAEHGYVVVANDHLGHGRSIAGEEELGHFPEVGGWDKVVADIGKLHTLTAARFPARPYFLFGHSMGSYLVRSYIIRRNSGLDGVILSGSGQQSRAVLTVGRLQCDRVIRKHGVNVKSQMLHDLAFGKNNSMIKNPRTAFDWLSRDAAAVDAYVADLLCGFVSSAGLYREMVNGIDYCSRARNIARMKKELPILFLSGDNDPVGDYGEGVIRVYRSFLKAGMMKVTMRLYHEGRHEMLNELNRAEVYADVLEWLNARVGR
jgi:alpha-beta hydrolase superfamily lysophospholipase